MAMLGVVALYAPTLSYGLVNYDDPWLIRDNWIVQHPSWSSIRTIFFELDSPGRFTLGVEYLPVRDVSVMLDFAIWGTSYGGFHLTNVVIYLAAIVLWFQALTGFGIDRRVAGLAILIWALHPSHAESVAWLTERKGLLGAAFAGACGLGYVRFRAAGRARWLAFAMAMAVCAVWSKAIAAFAIASLAGLDLALPVPDARRRRLVGLGAIAVVGAAAFVPVLLIAASVKIVGTGVTAPAGRFELVAGVLGFYVELGAMTIRNAVSYPLSIHGPSSVEVVLGIAGALALLWAVATPRGVRWAPSPTVRAAGMLWLFGWLPVSHLILPLQMIYVADRYLLVPSLGLAVAIAYGVWRIPSRRARIGLAAALVVACAVRTMDARSTWRDSVTLWERAVVVNPDDSSSWSMYADLVMDEGRTDLAFEIIHRALRASRAPRLLLRKALFLQEIGAGEQALPAMREAAMAGEPRAMMNLGLLLYDRGRYDEAFVWAKASAQALPLHAPARRALGKIALAVRKYDLALSEFEAALAVEPWNPANQYNVALALVALGRGPEAIPYLRACSYDPSLRPRIHELLRSLHR